MKLMKISLLIILAALIGLKIYLPSFLKHYVENQINKIPEYRLKIKDIEVHFINGSYTIHNAQLWKIPKQLPIPYIQISALHFSIDWASLLKGKLVAKVTAQKPIINFVDDPQKENQQLSIDNQWISLVKTLFPLNINQFSAHNGEIYFRSYKGHPPFSNYIKNIELTIQNMQNATRSSTLLSSTFNFTGTPMNNGEIKIIGRFDPFNAQPTFSLKTKLTSLKIASIANLIKHYILVNIAGGQFNLYGEIAAAKGQTTGYVKPFLKDLKIENTKKESLTAGIVTGLAKMAAKVLEDSHTKTVATKIKISGNIENPDTSILSIIGYLIQHAFIRSLLPQIDYSIGVENIIYGKKPSFNSKFPIYKK